MTIENEDLMDLTKSQLQNIIKQIKEKLNLGITGKNKEELVKTILMLHRGNKFNGKKLLSYGKDAHIEMPQRKIKEPNIKKIAEKKVKKLKESKTGQLKLLQDKFDKLKNPSLGQIEALKAKLRVIKKMK